MVPYLELWAYYKNSSAQRSGVSFLHAASPTLLLGTKRLKDKIRTNPWYQRHPTKAKYRGSHCTCWEREILKNDLVRFHIFVSASVELRLGWLFFFNNYCKLQHTLNHWAIHQNYMYIDIKEWFFAFNISLLIVDSLQKQNKAIMICKIIIHFASEVKGKRVKVWKLAIYNKHRVPHPSIKLQLSSFTSCHLYSLLSFGFK